MPKFTTLTALLFLAGQFAQAADVAAGKAAYEINCMACHQIDRQTVGPSLIRLSVVYPEDKLPEFLKWTKNPGKNDPLAIQMPSMAHIPDESLTNIHAYLLEVSDGKKEKKGSPTFKKHSEPKRKLPYVVHGFFPDTSPASIAVVLPEELSLCWDTELCRIRYAWKSAKTRISAWRKEAILPTDPFYREISETPLFQIGDTKPSYLGYRLIDRHPEFQYKFGNMEVRELIANGPDAGSFKRTFKITGAPSHLELDLSHEGSVTLSSDQGSIENNRLRLSASQAANFTITVIRK